MIYKVSADFPGVGQSRLASTMDKFVPRISNPSPGISGRAWEGLPHSYRTGQREQAETCASSCNWHMVTSVSFYCPKHILELEPGYFHLILLAIDESRIIIGRECQVL